VASTKQLCLISLRLCSLVLLSVDLMRALTSCELKPLLNRWKHKTRSLYIWRYSRLWVFNNLRPSSGTVNTCISVAVVNLQKLNDPHIKYWSCHPYYNMVTKKLHLVKELPALSASHVFLRTLSYQPGIVCTQVLNLTNDFRYCKYMHISNFNTLLKI